MNPQKPNILVEDGRKLLAHTDKSVMVIITWDEKSEYQIVTIGKNRKMADSAMNLGNLIAEKLNITQLRVLEDRRYEHTS